MPAFLAKVSLRRWILLLVLAGTAFFFFRKYLPGVSLPTRSAMEAEVARLESRRKDLAVLKKKADALERSREQLRSKAGRFWQISGKNSEQTVVAEFTKLARKAQVKTHRVDKPRRNKVLDLTDIYEVEFSVQVTASMREVSRLLAEVESSDKAFYWSQCSIRPDNIRTPKNVRMTGRVKALVLSPEATEFLTGSEGRAL